MTEEFLVYYWMFNVEGRSYGSSGRDEIVVLRTGVRNEGAGPDFTNAMVRLGDTTWVGNVEIHLRSSDWVRHHHHEDEAYESIILHVVYQHDMDITRKNGEIIPVLCLRDSIESSTYKSYMQILSSGQWIPCAAMIHKTRSIVIRSWLDTLAVERLQMKFEVLEQMMVFSRFDRDQVFYQSLMASFGFGLNREPFEMLARKTPYRVVVRHREDPVQLEALLFGQSGFLERRYRDAYPNKLRQEYLYLRHKYDLKNIPAYLWKFMRLRPGNFPTVRLAQVSMLLHQHSDLHKEVIACDDQRQVREVFRVKAGEYWNNHYLFDKTAKASVKQLDKQTIDLLVINHVVPFIFFEGRSRSDEAMTGRSVRLLSSLPPENNLVIRRFGKCGLSAGSASDSQGMLQLKRAYCDRKRCLECRIGNDLMR